MKSMLTLLFLLSFFQIIAQPANPSDSIPSRSKSGRQIKTLEMKDINQGGAFRIFITSYGFGLGGFYRLQFDETLAYQLELEISPGKDEREFEEFDYYGFSYTRNKINSLLLIPITNALTYRMFKDDIVENFRPYLSAGVGPLIGYSYPYKGDSFSGLGDGIWKVGFTGFIGFGADFGMNFTSLQGVSFKYTFNYLPDGVPLLVEAIPLHGDGSDPSKLTGYDFRKKPKDTFQSLQLSLNIGKMWTR